MKTKTIYTIIIALMVLMSLSIMSVSMAQSPDKMTYQSVIRNTTGNLIANQAVGIKISILQGAPGGTVVFAETFTPTTTANGLISLEIGSGTLVSGSIASIDWSLGPYFLKTEIDPAGGTTYSISSVTQFLSVPYALYSAKAGATAGTAGGDLNGSYPNPTVVGIQSKPVSVTSPAIDQVLVWDGVNWTPGANVSGPASGDLSGTYPGPTVSKLQTRTVSAAAPATNDALVWNGAAWAPMANVSGAAGGDLSGSYPNPVVVGIQSKPVSNTAPALNNVLVWNGAQWIPSPGSSLGTNYWTLNGTNQIYNNNAGGLVGIGTATPANKLEVLQTGTTSAGLFSNTNAANSASTVSITTNGANATALSVSGPGIWGSAIGITNTVSGMEWRTSVNGTTYSVTKIPGSTFTPFTLLSDGQVEFPSTAGATRFHILDNGNVGIGINTPAYKLDVLHGGSTGAHIASTSGFSTVDIDAASGDAALRFQKAGVGQWNIRNRPADDYLEIFELGGGGSRMVIQDATGNVGIGATVAPAYRLDVEHGGATGIRSKSTASFSVVDIDAASGDAALRFAKAGVNQWNIRNRPADDYLEIFELGGGGSRMVIQDATGNVGIGETNNPTYRLDVLHGGATGARIKSSSSFSVVDIDAQSGDAALRFVNNGVNRWNTRNDPANNNYQIFQLGGGGERMRIEAATGKVVVDQDLQVVGTLSKGAGAFKIDHPLDPENKYLIHSFVESPDMMNIYNGNVVTDATGKATVQLPDYFEALNMEFRYQLTVIGTFAQAIISKEVSNNRFEIATNQPDVKVSWQVTGIRHDAYAQKNRIPNTVEKEPENRGKYLHPASFNQPESKGIFYTAAEEGVSSLNYTAPAQKHSSAGNTGGSLDPVVIPAAKSAPANSGGSLDPVIAPKGKTGTVDLGGSVSDVTPAAQPKVPAKPVEKNSNQK